MTRRLGKFRIGRVLIEKQEDLIYKIMGTVIVTRCEYVYAEKVFEYTAISKQFKSLNEAEVIPTYMAVVDGEDIRFEVHCY